MSDLDEKRDLNRGFGDGMSRAFEIAVTPIVFGALGYGIDALAGTAPAFTIALAAFAVVGMFVRLWYGYDAEMRVHESSSRWAAGRPVTDERAEGIDLWATRPGAQQ